MGAGPVGLTPARAGRFLRIGASAIAGITGLLTLAFSGSAAWAAQGQAPPAGQQQAADSVAADTLPVPTFPIFPEPATQEAGVAASWELPDLLANGALSFADLLEFTPSLVPVRAGFMEGPQAAVFAGRGAAGLQVDLDGYRWVPLAGGPLDLHLLSLVELQRVQLNREPGGYRVSATSYRNERRDPYSRIEAGTGDADTNLLRAFLSSRIARAAIGFGYDRVDTRGRAELGEAERDVVWASLAHPLPWDLWGQLEYRSSSSARQAFPSQDRSDLILRVRRDFGDGWHADLVAGAASFKQDSVRTPNTRAAIPAPEPNVSAKQLALRAARVSERWRAQLALRGWDGEGVPRFAPEAALELQVGPASLYASGRYAYWKDFHSAAGYAGLNLQLPLGLRLLAEVEEGDRGLFGRLPRRRLSFTRWTAGAELRLWGWRVGGRAGRWRADPSPALGPPVDSLIALPGGTAGVLEVWASGPVLKLFGGTLEALGRYQTRDAVRFLYWPEEDWSAGGRYHVLALGEQLEVRLEAIGGIRGAMLVQDLLFDTGLLSSSGQLNWFRAEAVVRVKDVHIFYNYEFFDASPSTADVPGLVLPTARAHFGVKWAFWN